MINSLTLKIADQAGSIATNGPGTTIVLHIRDSAYCRVQAPVGPKGLKL